MDDRLDDMPNEPSAHEPPADEPPAETPPVDEPPAETPPVDEPPIEVPPAQEPPMQEPPIDEPPTHEPPAEEPPAEEPPTESLPADAGPDVATSAVSGETVPFTPIEAAEAESLAAEQATAVMQPVTAAPISEIDIGPERRGNRWVWIGLLVGVLIAGGAIAYAWWYSTARPVTTPNVVGKLPAQAVQTLNDAALRLGQITEVPTDEAPPGTIVEQTPRAFARVKPGRSVSLIVAAAPEGAKVPDVSGRSFQEAAKELARQRLAAVRTTSYSATAAADFVIGQMPGPGEKLQPGASVALVVSAGAPPSQIRVPRLDGLAEADAISLLSMLKLRALPYRSVNASTPAGQIATQTPKPEVIVPYDAPVQLWVSQGFGSTAVSVPDVTGSKRAAALALLKRQGFKPQTVAVSSTFVAAGNVISQMPPAGTKTAKGSVVGLLVSRGDITVASVPDLLNRNAAEARTLVQKAGFRYMQIEVETQGRTSGQVFGQFPAASSPSTLGYPVIVIVAK